MNPIGGIDSTRIQAMVQQLKAMANQAQPAVNAPDAASNGLAIGDQAATPVDFGNVLKASLDKVNETQQIAGQLSDRFTKGDESVSLSEVMIAGQKANILCRRQSR